MRRWTAIPKNQQWPFRRAVFDGTEIPRLDADRKITPISDVEELIEVCGRVLEDSSLIDDGERAIDGISRLHGEKPE